MLPLLSWRLWKGEIFNQSFLWRTPKDSNTREVDGRLETNGCQWVVARESAKRLKPPAEFKMWVEAPRSPNRVMEWSPFHDLMELIGAKFIAKMLEKHGFAGFANRSSTCFSAHGIGWNFMLLKACLAWTMEYVAMVKYCQNCGSTSQDMVNCSVPTPRSWTRSEW